MKKPIRVKVLWCLEIRVPTAGPICDFRVAGLIQSLLVTIGSCWQILREIKEITNSKLLSKLSDHLENEW